MWVGEIRAANFPINSHTFLDKSWEPAVSVNENETVSMTVSVCLLILGTTFVFMCKLKSEYLSCRHLSHVKNGRNGLTLTPIP